MEQMPELSPGKLAQILDAMGYFHRAGRLVKLILAMISHTLGPVELSGFR